MFNVSPTMLANARATKSYAIASGLKGFGPHTELRVRVFEVRDGTAFVITADLCDVGTKLALDPTQLTACD